MKAVVEQWPVWKAQYNDALVPNYVLLICATSSDDANLLFRRWVDLYGDATTYSREVRIEAIEELHGEQEGTVLDTSTWAHYAFVRGENI